MWLIQFVKQIIKFHIRSTGSAFDWDGYFTLSLQSGDVLLVVFEIRIRLKKVATNEHVKDAERNVFTIKDGMRCSVIELRRIRIHTLPKQVIIHMVYLSLFWTNAPPATNGISTVHSPREFFSEEER